MSEFNPWQLQQQTQQSPIPSFLPDVNAILAPKAQSVGNWWDQPLPATVSNPSYNSYAGNVPAANAFTQSMQGVSPESIKGIWSGGGSPSSSWFGDTFSGVDSTMKAFGQKMQDWGVTGGKDAKGNAFNGWGGLAFGAAQGIANWMGARDTYALQNKSVDASIANAKENMRINKFRLNDDMEARQIARVASNPGAYQSVGDYMKVNRV